MFDNDYGPDLVLIKDNTYVRPGSIDYLSIVPNEGTDTGEVQIFYNSGSGIRIPDVTASAFKLVADAANWYALEKERKAALPVKED